MSQDIITNYCRTIELHGIYAWLCDLLSLAFEEARKHKLTTFNENTYETHWPENITRLAEAILGGYYHPSRSIAFIVHDPVIREIFAALFTDRIVHHFLHMISGDWWDRRLISDSYSCRKGKGGAYAISRVHRMMRQVSHNFTEPAYVIKLDLRGYFMSLPRLKLYNKVRDGLYQQFRPYFNRSAAFEIYKICKYLWRETLLDDPVKHAERRGRLADWDDLPPEKSLFCQPPGYGIVIGNYTSQLVSNIYLDDFDRFVKYDLGYKYYGRYVDDFLIMVPVSQYERAKQDIKKMEVFLKTKELTLHPKKRYHQSIYKGVPFLGVRIYPHCLYPSNRLQAKFDRTMHRLALGDSALSTDTVISYIGQMKHLNGDQFVRNVFTKYGLEYELYLEAIGDAETRRPLAQIADELRTSSDFYLP